MATLQSLADELAALKAQVAQNEADYSEAMDNIFMLVSGYLVWVMSAGFCFLEMGSVRYKNAQNVLAKNMVAPVIAYSNWYICGFGLAFGVLPATATVPNKFIGGHFFALNEFWSNKQLFRKWFFQGAFCDTSPSIVSGCIAERMTLSAFMIHTYFLTAFIYPCCVYWAWSGYGWLNYSDPVTGKPVSLIGPCFLDWAGSGVIHFVGGVAGLVGAIIVGPRKGRFDADVNEDDFLPHSIPFTVLGTFILWFGWYGFNPGCTPSMHSAVNAYASALATTNSTLAPCAAGLVAFFLRRAFFGARRLDISALCNGILAGLVAITGPCGFVEPWEAVIIGALGGLFYVLNAALLPRLKIDDPIEAISVHLVNGIWGAIAVGLFGNPSSGIGGNGAFYGGNQLGVQLVALLAFLAWSASLSALIWLPMRFMGMIRYSDDFQDIGSDEMQFEPRQSEHSPAKVYSSPKEAAVVAAWPERFNEDK